MRIKEILQNAASQGASDVFLVGGLPLTYKVNGAQLRIEPEKRLMPSELAELITELYQMIGRDASLIMGGCVEDDFSFALPGYCRYRANVFWQRGCLSAVFRIIRFGVPNPAEFNIPREILDLAGLKSGLVLVTGPAGSGKTSTLACIIDEMNRNQDRTIITMEDPIEIIHHHDKSIVIQREISTDTLNYSSALRASLRESPDVLLLGEIRDSDTMEVAMSAAETGQLLFSSLHTLSAADTIDRIIDFFPEKKQNQVRAQLARVLKCVVCQRLVPTVSGTRVPAFEIMQVTPAVQNLIREGKSYQFNSVIQEGSKLGMRSMNSSLAELVNKGVVDKKTAINYSDDPDNMKRKLEA